MLTEFGKGGLGFTDIFYKKLAEATDTHMADFTSTAVSILLGQKDEITPDAINLAEQNNCPPRQQQLMLNAQNLMGILISASNFSPFPTDRADARISSAGIDPNKFRQLLDHYIQVGTEININPKFAPYRLLYSNWFVSALEDAATEAFNQEANKSH